MIIELSQIQNYSIDILKSRRGGLEVERLLHKLHGSVSVDQSPLGAAQWTKFAMDPICYVHPGCV